VSPYGSASWAECTDREVQIASAWSNNEIRFNLQPRALSSAQPLYVYVVDPNGVFNPSGVALGSDSSRPNPPSSVSAD
jgi:hypothetical protein